MHRAVNRLQHGLLLTSPFVVPESQDAKTLLLQPLSAHRIVVLGIGMLAAVELDDQLLLETDEIDDVTAKGLLTAELETREPLGPKLPPQLRLGGCLGAA